MVEMLFAEVKVLFVEGDKQKALRTLEELFSRYPKRLSTEHFLGIYEQMQTYQGLLLANLDRWDEAKPFLEKRCLHSCVDEYCYVLCGPVLLLSR